MPGLEVKTERDHTVALDGRPRRDVVRILFRAPGERRWHRFLVIPSEGQTLEGIEANAATIAASIAEKWPHGGV